MLHLTILFLFFIALLLFQIGSPPLKVARLASTTKTAAGKKTGGLPWERYR